VTKLVQYYSFADQVVLLIDTRVHILSPQDDRLQAHCQMTKLYVSQNTEDIERSGPGVKSQLDETRITDATAGVSRRIGDLAVYGKLDRYVRMELTSLMYSQAHYFESVGMINIVLMASCTAIYAFCVTLSPYILKWWIEATPETSWLYILTYLFVSIIAWTATNGTMWFAFFFSMNLTRVCTNHYSKVNAYCHRFTIWLYPSC
jgi:hypothetical protein